MTGERDGRSMGNGAGARTATAVYLCVPPQDSRLFLTELPVGNARGIEIVSFSNDMSTLEEDVEQHEATIVIVSPQVRNYSDQIVARVARLARIVVVIGLVPPTGDWVKQLTTAGAIDVLRTPVTSQTIDSLVAHAAGWVRKAGELRQQAGWMAAVPAEVRQAVQSMGYKRGVWVVWGPKGGVGKTTVACNVASMLGVVAQTPTLLLDANMNGGHVDFHMGLDTDTRLLGLARLFQQKGQLTAGDVRSFVTTYPGTALDVLPGIVRPEHASDPALLQAQGEQFIEALLDRATGMYDFVLVDVGSAIHVALHRKVLTKADGVLVVTTPDRCSVIDVKNAVDALVNLAGMDRTRFTLVVNKWMEAAGLRRRDITRESNMAEAGLVPMEDTGAMMFAVNEGKPYVLARIDTSDPKQQAVLEALEQVTEQVYPPMGAIWASRSKGLPGRGDGLLDKIRRAIG